MTRFRSRGVAALLLLAVALQLIPLPAFGPATARAEAPVPLILYLDSDGSKCKNRPSRGATTFTLADAPPTDTAAKCRDSSVVNFPGGNPWAPVGAWTRTPAAGTLSALEGLHAWIGLKNSDDQGTQFDVLAEAFKGGTLVASGLIRCITGLTRDPRQAREVVVPFGPVTPAPFNGTTDVLSVRLSARIGTTADGAKCPGPGGSHASALGLRVYYDAAGTPSGFMATLGPGGPAPVFVSTPLTVGVSEVPYTYPARAEASGGGAVRYALMSGPSGMSVVEDTGLVRWRPSPQQVGQHPVEIRAIGIEGAQAPQAFTVRIIPFNVSPSITSVPPTFARLGQEYVYDVEAFDPEGGVVAFAFAEPPPSGMTIEPAAGLIRFTPAAVGTHRVAVRATDPLGASDVQVYVLDVIDPAVALQVLSPTGTHSVAVGQTLTLPFEATHARALFSVDPMPANAAVAGNAFVFTPSPGQAGGHTVSFRARFADMAASSVARITVTRPNQPPQISPIGPRTVAEGGQLVFAVQATDPDGDPLTYSAPGLGLANAFFNTVSRQFSFFPGSGQAGSHAVVFRVSDGRAATQITVPIEVTGGAGAPIQDLTVDPPQNPTFAGRQAITGSTTGQPGTIPPAQRPVVITGLAPSAAKQGRAVSVDVTGLNTAFAQGAYRADFGEGIVVDALAVLSPTSARAAIRLGPAARLGTRQVRLMGPGADVPSVLAFTVEQGTSTITGVVLDPFTQQPLAGVEVSINGTDFSVLTDEQGRFTLVDVPSGTVTVVVTFPNYEVKRISLAVGPSDTITLADPVPLSALARPSGPGGTLPRAPTVASVLDRGVTNKGGGYTFDQARAVVIDTMISVGGIEAGVVDESGRQLNPRVAGTGELSLTQEGVDQQARALMLGDVYTVRDLYALLTGAFSPIGDFRLGHLVEGFQRAANEAWARPSDPSSAMAIVLFNEGPSLQPRRPLITADTRFNRFQMFLLLSSLLVHSRITLEPSAERLLRIHGVDFEPMLPRLRFSRTPAAPVPGLALGGALTGLWASVTRIVLPRPAYAEGAGGTNECGSNSILCATADLQTKKTFSKVWRTIVGGMYFDAAFGGVIGAGIATAQQMVMMGMLGTLGGRASTAIIAVNAAAAFTVGASAILFFKLVIGWYIGLVAASFEPPPPRSRSGLLNLDRDFVISFERSGAEIQSLRQPGNRTLERGYVYRLYRFPSCTLPPDQGSAEAIDLDAVEEHPEDPVGPMRFTVPRSMLRPGPNHFRVRTFQYVHNSEADLVEGLERYDADEDGVLSVLEFQRAGLGDEYAFLAADQDRNGTLDAAEFRREPAPAELELFPGMQNAPLRLTLGHHNLTPAAYQEALAFEDQDIQSIVRQRPLDLFDNLKVLRQEYAQTVLETELDFYRNNMSALHLTNEVVTEAHASSDATARLLQADAEARMTVQAQEMANRYYQKHFNRNATPEQVALVKNALDVYRRASVNGQNLNSMAAHLVELDRAIAEVKAGRTPNPVKIPQPGAYGDYGVGPDPSKVATVTVTPSNVAQIEADAKLPHHEAMFRFDSEVAQGKALFGGLFSERGIGGPQGTILVPGRVNAASEGYALFKDGLKNSSGLTPDQVEARLQTLRGLYAKYGPRSLAASRQGQAQLTKQQEAMTRLRLQKIRPGGSVERPASLGLLYEKGVARGADLGGSLVGQSWTMLAFLEGVRVLSSDFSEDCHVAVKPTVPLPTETFPPSFEPDPSGDEIKAVILDQQHLAEGLMRERLSRGLLKREYPGDSSLVEAVDAGFPPAFVAFDRRRRIYVNNVNSNGPKSFVDEAGEPRQVGGFFGGRMFRYEILPPAQGAASGLTVKREFVGSVNYFSLAIQVARPAQPVAVTVGPPFKVPDERGTLVETQDLFVADIDVLDGQQRIVRIPISRIDTQPSVYPETERHRIAGETVLVDGRLRLSGPSDLEVGPELASVTSTKPGPNSIMMLSDEESLFAIVRDPATGAYSLAHVVSIPGRRWSGLAFDRFGTLYFADYARGDIFALTWRQLREMILKAQGRSTAVIRDDSALLSLAFPIARGLDQPGDIELEGVSAHPGRVLHVSTFEGIRPINLPLIGRLDGASEVRMSALGIEHPAQVRDVLRNFYVVTPSREDLAALRTVVRLKRSVDATGEEFWQTQVVILSEHGATVIAEAPPPP